MSQKIDNLKFNFNYCWIQSSTMLMEMRLISLIMKDDNNNNNFYFFCKTEKYLGHWEGYTIIVVLVFVLVPGIKGTVSIKWGPFQHSQGLLLGLLSKFGVKLCQLLGGWHDKNKLEQLLPTHPPDLNPFAIGSLKLSASPDGTLKTLDTTTTRKQNKTKQNKSSFFFWHPYYYNPKQFVSHVL